MPKFIILIWIFPVDFKNMDIEIRNFHGVSYDIYYELYIRKFSGSIDTNIEFCDAVSSF